MSSICDIDRTSLLRERSGRAADYQFENEALRRLSEEVGRPDGNVLSALAEAALALCDADSSGVSILEPDSAQPMFRWHAIEGEWKKYQGQGLPRDGSPCGLTIARNQTVLMTHPELVYLDVADADPSIEEVLLAPFHILGQPLGTVWVIFHAREGHPQRQFDLEHERVIRSLARFASNAFLLQEQVRNAVERRNELYRANRRLNKILERLQGLPESGGAS